MKRIILIGILSLVFACSAMAAEQIVMETNMGNITLELNREKAPVTVKNFLSYVDRSFYDGTIFHRVIGNFMIQGGGFDQKMKKMPTDPAIINEADNGLTNDKGTIAMARTNVVDSATCQFFINLKDNDSLNHRGKSPKNYGYAVFGRVIEGMDVVKKIAKVRTGSKSGMRDVPQTSVVLNKVRRVEAKKK